MGKVFRDTIIDFKQYDLTGGEDIFERILEERKKESDSKRFFLKFIPTEELDKYDFQDKNSLKEFRRACICYENPLKEMGGCNIREQDLEKGLRYAGMKLSDPYGKIPGAFDVRDHVITYSPIFPLCYEERDISKFANDIYFTDMTFEEIIMNQINNGLEFYVHTGQYRKMEDILKYGNYVFEQIDKKQMLEYATNPEQGYKVFEKSLKH